jgi:potassium efflux system protein
MLKFSTVQLFCFILLLFAVAPCGLSAQSVGEVSQVEDVALVDSTLEDELEAATKALADLENEPDLSDAEKAELQELYTEAIRRLEDAIDDSEQAAEYRNLMETVGSETIAVQQELEQLPTPDEAAQIPEDVVDDIEDLEQTVESTRANLAQLNDLQETVSRDIEASELRPIEIEERLPEVRTELDELKATDEPDDSDLTWQDAAERLLWIAKHEELIAEIDLLKEELNTQARRSDLLEAKGRLVNQKVENAQATLSAYEDLLNRAQMSEADRLMQEVEGYVSQVKSMGVDISSLVAEVKGLAVSYKETAIELRDAGQANEEQARLLAELSRDFIQMQKGIQLGGLDGVLSQILVEHRRKLPNPEQIAYSLEVREMELRNIRLDEFDYEQRFQALEDEDWGFEPSTSPAVAQLLEMRQELLTKLLKEQGRLINLYSNVDLIERNYWNLVLEVRHYLWEKLFWKKSSPALWAMRDGDFKGALHWLFGPGRFSEFYVSIETAADIYLYLSVFYLVMWLSLILFRRRIIAIIEATEAQIRFISNDKFSHTLRALLGTTLLALPVPLLFGGLSWLLSRDPNASDWVLGVSRGLHWSFYITLWGCFVTSASRARGVGIVHFGWSEERALRMRRLLTASMLVGVPVVMVICCLLYDENSRHFDLVGRLCYLGFQLWLLVDVWKTFNPRTGIFAEAVQANPNRVLARTRVLWFPLLLAAPVLLMLLALSGYFVTAMVFTLELYALFAIATGGSLCYFTVLRWFMIRERKLALAEAIQERKERIELAAVKKDSASSDEDISQGLKEPELDLAAIGKQTRRMMRSLFTIAVIVAVWYFWSNSMPIGGVFGELSIAGWLNPFDIIHAVAVMIIVTVVVKNLPGLLELAGLRASSMDIGTRYAITSVAQYTVLAIGLAIACDVLHVNWSTFGWIVTALSVGLGFGLQEIVANFVCGIILLFERPIRVGDVITIKDVTGTVNQIRMRATTITNWDRQELVVPNKQFISDALINWTLSSATNRAVIEVGVAYGTDTIRAREILLELANEHPIVLSDPAPSATFSKFGDSCLDLALRIYLPDLSNRVATITSLHDSINQRFNEEGIEIAFPQRDIHIRSMPEPVPGAAKEDKLVP